MEIKKCGHATCQGDTCRRPPKPKKIYYLKRTPLNTTNSRIGKQYKPKDDELQKWFEERRLEMSGVCMCGCGRASSKSDDKYFKFSICHILPKRNVKSVKTHPLNWIELAFWADKGSSCHTNFDNQGASEWPKKEYWPIIVERFKQFYHLIPASEWRFIPQCLLNEIVPLDNFTFPTDL